MPTVTVKDRTSIPVDRIARASAVLGLSVFYFGNVFQLFRGIWLTSGLGDWVDPYLINGLLEDWYYSLRHFSDPASPPMFFPATGTLGYSHGLILYVPFYVLVRPWLHPFTAHTLAIFLVMVTGACCLYAIFRKCLSLGFLESLILTTAFCTSPNVINGSVAIWSQRASVFLIPPILLLLLVSLAQPDGSRKLVGCGLAGLLATLMLTQDFNSGFLAFLVFGLLLLGARLILGWPSIGMRAWLTRATPAHGTGRRRATWISLLLTVVFAAWAWIIIGGRIPLINIEVHHHHWERPGLVALVTFIGFLVLRAAFARGYISRCRNPRSRQRLRC